MDRAPEVIRAFIIGCGRIAGLYDAVGEGDLDSHAQAYAAHPGFQVVGCHDIDQTRAETLSGRLGARAYWDALPDALREAAPDVVTICTPTRTHAEVLLETLSVCRPKVVILEKPVCESEAELARLLAAAAASPAEVIVNHSRRFDPKHRRLRELCRTGILGEPAKIDMLYYGGWKHIGVHLVDLIHFLFADALTVTSVRVDSPGKHPGDPTLAVEGRVGAVPVRFRAHDEALYQVLECDFFFRRGRVRIEDGGERMTVYELWVNARGERVLREAPGLSSAAANSPILNCLNLVEQYVRSGDRELLREVGLREAERTMRTVWSVANHGN